jgi:hypothetical protein
MPDYNLYKLSNSNEIPRFVGSPVPELAQAFQVQQGKYDTALAISDEIENGIKGASSLVQDQALLQELKNKYRGKIKGYAEKGDYENMVRETTRDAKEFSREYTPIMANQKAVSAYRDEIEKLQKDNKISKKLADAAFEYSTNTYKGLQKDPVTGQYRNQFTGYMPGKELDVSDFVKKALQDIDPQTIGWNVRKVITANGAEFYQESGGKTVKLPIERLRPFIEAYKSQSAEYQSHVAQEKLLDNWKIANVSSESIAQLAAEGKISPQMYEQATKLAQEQGMPLPQAMKLIAESHTAQRIDRDIDVMAHKYIRDDRESTSKLMGETEETKRRNDIKALDYQDPFGAPILVPIKGTVAATPEKLEGSLADARKNFTSIREQNALFMKDLTPVKQPDGTVQYMRGNENVTDAVLRAKTMEVQAAQAQLNLVNREKQAKEQAQYVITPTLVNASQKAYDDAYRKTFNIGPMPEWERKSMAEKARTAVMENDPGFRRYKKILAEDAQNGSVQVNALGFNSKDAEKHATEKFKDFALNLDAETLKAGAFGLSKVDGTPFNNEDYQKMKDDAKFAGWFLDPADGNKVKFLYNVGKVTRNAKGNQVGEQSLVKMDALPGTMELLQQTGQLDLLQMMTADAVGNLEKNDSKITEFSPIKGLSVTVQRYNNTVLPEKPDGTGTMPYKVTYRYNGKEESYSGADQDAIINSIIGTIGKSVQQKQK